MADEQGPLIESPVKPQNSLVSLIKENFRLLSLVALISIIAGSIGGAFGSASVSQFSGMKKLAGNTAFNQKITLSEDSAVIDVVKKASPAVVSIVVSKDISKLPGFGFNPFFGYTTSPQDKTPNIQKVGAGSGFFVSADGLILTNRHVVEDVQASYSVVTNDGKSYDATVLARDPINDLAIVKVQISGAQTLELADSSKIEIGQKVIAIGNSLGEYQNTVTTGVVSGIGRSITAGSSQGSEQLEGVIQTDAAINPGNSGGPLLNIAGQVVGINTAIDQQGQLVGFAIQSNDAAKAIASFQKSGKIVRPQLGVRYVMITEQLAKDENLPRSVGALIVGGGNTSSPAVLPGSAAEKAGLLEGDIILEVNGQAITEEYTLTRALKNFLAGDTLTLKILQKGQEKEIPVTLGEAK
jgi:serine protease Do